MVTIIFKQKLKYKGKNIIKMQKRRDFGIASQKGEDVSFHIKDG